MGKLLLWMTETRLWHWIVMHVLPYIRFSMYYTRFSGDRFVEAYKILTPGQFILTLDESKGTAFLVPGFMTHATYVVGNCQYDPKAKYEVAEMTHHNFTKSHLFTVCKESSRILICDCLDWDNDHKQRMLAAVPSMEGAQYDVTFTLGVSTLYCSELVFQLDRIARFWMFDGKAQGEFLAKNPARPGALDVNLDDVKGLGTKYISPDGLLFGKNVRVVWDSDGELTGMMGPQARELCKQKGYIK